MAKAMARLDKLFGALIGGSLTLTGAAAFASQPVDKGLGFQPSVTPQMDQIVWFHDVLLMPIITITTLFVLALLIYVIWRFSAKRNPTPSTTTHHALLEVLWTALPVLILIVISIPSFRILYYQEVIPETEITLKATGNQWYWSYEYLESGVEFDANPDFEGDNAATGTWREPRLLTTDNQIVLPVDTKIEMLLTASDVIHAWTIPAFGVKKDAVPGRTNHIWFEVKKEGTYYGQCSEICGLNHGYMPIEVKIVSKDAYTTWSGQAKLDLEQGREITPVETIIAQLKAAESDTTLVAVAE
jgi:cytochrome c oxidase subunit 2